MGGPVLFWVQHLLGSGHLRRTALIASTLAGYGVDCVIASGGMPLETIDTGEARLVQLPPVAAGDHGFATLVGEDGRTADARLMARRGAMLAELTVALRPRLVVTETWPFGRRKFGAEVLGLLEAVRRADPGAGVVCSVRDILQRTATPGRHDAMRDLALAHCDRVMVHGSEAFVPFSRTFPQAHALGPRLVYTGYVAGLPPFEAGPRGPGDGEVLVSCGGGAVGRRLLETAVEARALSGRAAGRTWRLLTGDGGGLRVAAGEGVVVEANRRDFPHLLARCAVSVSRGGYNTVTDLLRTRARAVICPFSAGGETEQSERAHCLETRGVAVVLPEDALTAANLAGAVDRAFDLDPPQAVEIGLDGARTSARLLAQWSASYG